MGLSGDTDNEMNCLLMDHYYSYAWVALIVKSCVRCKTWVMVVDERGVAQNGAYTSDAVNDRVIS